MATICFRYALFVSAVLKFALFSFLVETAMSFQSTFSTADESNLIAQQVPASTFNMPLYSTDSTADEWHLRRREEYHTTTENIPSSASATTTNMASMFEPRTIEEMLRRPTENINNEPETASASYFRNG